VDSGCLPEAHFFQQLRILLGTMSPGPNPPDGGTLPELNICQLALLLSPGEARGAGRTSCARRVEPEWRNAHDNTARKEFGFTQVEIEAPIDAGQLQYRVGVIQGSHWLRLLRPEVDELMKSTYNDRDHRRLRGGPNWRGSAAS
jgi:hypothetical protein